MPQVNLRGVAWFVSLAFGIAWLLALPLWISPKGLAAPWAPAVLALMMLAPSVAAVVVSRWISPIPGKIVRTGLWLGPKGSGWGWYWCFSWTVILGFGLIAPFVAAGLGRFTLDITDFSGFRGGLVAAGVPDVVLREVPVKVIAWAQIVALPLGPLCNSPFALGEEYGWRGYLLPQLLPLGQWRALLLSGVIWGAWHAPVIARGYNYPGHPIAGVFMMIALCIILGILLGWTRLATGSVWPAVIGHGATNASAGAIILFSKAGTARDATIVGLTGWTGWLLPIVCILLLVGIRKLPVKNPPDNAWLLAGPPSR